MVMVKDQRDVSNASQIATVATENFLIPKHVRRINRRGCGVYIVLASWNDFDSSEALIMWLSANAELHEMLDMGTVESLTFPAE